MAWREGRIYRHSKLPKIILRTVLIVIAAFIIMSVTLYFHFQKYIIYTDDGIIVDVPWLREDSNSIITQVQPEDDLTSAEKLSP